MQWIASQVEETMIALRHLWSNKRLLTFQTLNLAMIVFSALMIWKGLMVVTNSESPVVVVLSGSMEPAFQRGDILFLTNYDDPVQVGEIVVFKIAGREIPIVHRVLRVHERNVTVSSSGGASARPVVGRVEVDYLTKGDNNPIDDRNLYAQDQMWLRRTEILGRARAAVPHVGYVTILLNEHPSLKFILIGLMGLFVLTGKEQ